MYGVHLHIQIPRTMRFMKTLADCQIFVFSNTLKKVCQAV